MAVNTSATASLNARPAWTRRRTCSTHSSGIRSTCFWPAPMKVKDQSGCPSPCAQEHAGLPHRRWVGAKEPGRASAGIVRRRSSAPLRWRRRAAREPLGLARHSGRNTTHRSDDQQSLSANAPLASYSPNAWRAAKATSAEAFPTTYRRLIRNGCWLYRTVRPFMTKFVLAESEFPPSRKATTAEKKATKAEPRRKHRATF